MENFSDIQEKGKRLDAFINLGNNIKYSERRMPTTFNDLLYLATMNPALVFRDIFQLFDDMVNYFIPEADSDISNKKIGFVDYNFSSLFVENCDNPFFADRLFANRFMNLVKAFRKGVQNNRIYLFEGPPGSGKSTFLNNLLQKFEEYTRTPEGVMYKTYWSIDTEILNGFNDIKLQMKEIAEGTRKKEMFDLFPRKQRTIDFSCPNNDHPILQVPVKYRKEFLNELIPDEKFKEKLFNDAEFKWVLKDIPCHICNSLTTMLMDALNDPMEVFNMIRVKVAKFDRQFGEGVSIFNPGDPHASRHITNDKLQDSINSLFNTDDMNFIYSFLAKTNNGVLALMDIKEHNIQRMMDLHGIISDGVHKVDLVEERIKTLFVGLINPEDKKIFEEVKSFQDRITTVHIPYVLDFNTEVAIYRNKFGEKICDYFLPRVLENFAKILIATRLDPDSLTIKTWLKNPEKYTKYIDKNLFLLKMEIYAGKTPAFLSEEDLKNFDLETKRKIVAESANEGKKGLSGRKSIELFNTFFSKYAKEDKLINMDNVKEFFLPNNQPIDKEIPFGFIESLVRLYDFNILQEVKDSIYYLNTEQISRDIQNYLFCINYEFGETVKSVYTGDTITITDDYIKNFEAFYLGTVSTAVQRYTFRKEMLSEYISKTLAQEMRVNGKTITETEQFKNLFEKYTKNLKENALAPYIDNSNFRRALIDFNTQAFNSYDYRLQRDIKYMINNLIKKFHYTQEGAVQVSIYVIDNNLIKKF